MHYNASSLSNFIPYRLLGIGELITGNFIIFEIILYVNDSLNVNYDLGYSYFMKRINHSGSNLC